MSVLQILGIVFFILIPLVGFGVWKLYAKAKAEEKRCLDFDKSITLLPQLELNLQPSSLNAWSNDSKIKTDEITLREAGLQHQGYFINRSPACKLLVSVWQFKQCLTVALCEKQITSDKPSEPPITEYRTQAIARLNTGKYLCVANADYLERAPVAKESIVVFTQEIDPLAIMRQVKKHIPNHVRLLPVHDSVALFVENYETQSHWLWQKQQLRSGAIADLLERNGIDVTPDLISQLEAHCKSFLSQVYSDKVLQRLSQTPSISPAKWQEIQGKCVVVHEKMSAENLSSALFKALNGLTTEQTKELESLGNGGPIHDPITSFQEYLNSFNTAGAPKRIAKMELPVRAEIYLSD